VAAPAQAAERGRPAAAADLEDADAEDAAEGGLRAAASQPRQREQERGHACARPTPHHSLARIAYREVQRRRGASAGFLRPLSALLPPVSLLYSLCRSRVRSASALPSFSLLCFVSVCAPASVCLSVHLSAVVRPRQGPRQARASPPPAAPRLFPSWTTLGPTAVEM
jgi:hypothetical protein